VAAVPTGAGLRRRCGPAETSLAGSYCSGSLWASGRGAAGQCAAHSPRVDPRTHEKAAPAPIVVLAGHPSLHTSPISKQQSCPRAHGRMRDGIEEKSAATNGFASRPAGQRCIMTREQMSDALLLPLHQSTLSLLCRLWPWQLIRSPIRSSSEAVVTPRVFAQW
jgi:hypothetical protein